jgi:flagellar protein FlaF
MRCPGTDREVIEVGFSTSGSLLVIFIGLFIAMGSIYTTTSNTTDRVEAAYTDTLGEQTELTKTAINVTDATQNTQGNLTITVANNGSMDLAVSETSILLDGAFRSLDTFDSVTVDGADTDVWPPETLLQLEADGEPTVSRVKVVTDVGIADATAVREVTS